MRGGDSAVWSPRGRGKWYSSSGSIKPLSALVKGSGRNATALIVVVVVVVVVASRQGLWNKPLGSRRGG